MATIRRRGETAEVYGGPESPARGLPNGYPRAMTPNPNPNAIRPEIRYVQPTMTVRQRRRLDAGTGGDIDGMYEVGRGRREEGSFLGWLGGLRRFILLPITLPLRPILHLLRSPLTLSFLIRLLLLAFLLVVSGVMSTLAVGGWWLSWGRMGERSVEGWFVYGSKSRPTPHSYISLPPSNSAWYPDTMYDVEVELELIRPRSGGRGGMENDGGGNFMITVDFLSEKTNEPIMTIAQPCLPALPYVPSSFVFSLIPSLPSFPIPLTLNPYKILASISPIPLPFSGRRASSHLTYSTTSIKNAKDTYLLTRALTGPGDRGVVMRPSDGLKGKSREERAVGGLVVSVGREDGSLGAAREVKTTGWVVVRMIPRPTGLRWLLTSHPLPPLLILPPFAIFLTLTSALTSYLIITYCFRNVGHQSDTKSLPKPSRPTKRVGDGSDGALFREVAPTSDRLKGLERNASTRIPPQVIFTSASSPDDIARIRIVEEHSGADIQSEGQPSHPTNGLGESSGSMTSSGDVTPMTETTSDAGSTTE